jgi:hypothetical protein
MQRQKDIHEMMTSGVSREGKAPFQAFLPVPLNGNSTADDGYNVLRYQTDWMPDGPAFRHFYIYVYGH